MKLTGVRQVRNALGNIAATVPERIPAALKDVADDVVADVRPKLPRRTGRLAASLRATQTPDGAQVAMGGRDAPHGEWIERGGSRGRPLVPRGRYLGPAIEQAGPAVAQAVEKAVRKAVQDAR
jgi:hypothetical protein